MGDIIGTPKGTHLSAFGGILQGLWWKIATPALRMIFCTSKSVPESLALGLTNTVVVACTKVVHLLQLASGAIRVTPQIVILGSAIEICGPKLTTDNSRFDLDIVHTKSKIIDVQNPYI